MARGIAVLALGTVLAGAAAPPPAPPTLQSYFARTGPGMQTGGVRRIPIRTPKGDFSVLDEALRPPPPVRP